MLAAVLAPLAVRRSARHEAPAIDLEVFRSRTVALANAATFLYAVGFFGMLLANVLFLTSVWHYSTLQAGMAITPGPLLVAALSGPSGRLAARVGYGPVLVAGGLTFAAGLLFYVTIVGVEAHYLTHWLPGCAAGRPRRRHVLPGAERRRRGRAAAGALRHRWRHQPDGPPDRRGPRGGHPHRRRRYAGFARPGPHPLPHRLADGTLAVLGSAAISAFHRRPEAAVAPVVVLSPVAADAA